MPQAGLRSDRLDLQSGARLLWVDAGETHAIGGSSGTMLYVEDIYDNNSGPAQGGFGGQQLVSVNIDGSKKTPLVNDKAFIAIDYPTTLPDGKWVAFSAIYLPRTGGRSGPDLLAWLGITPQSAVAHGLPWDMFLVSSRGGAPIKISQSSDDQPHPAWLDATTLVYMGTYGMFKVEIGSNG